ncbi:hypothetical protein CRUP_027019 [Coryphaenoides rupestris]|nr:hypothetical protein CRUP_027019 [Coryphaenoides rupestris]
MSFNTLPHVSYVERKQPPGWKLLPLADELQQDASPLQVLPQALPLLQLILQLLVALQLLPLADELQQDASPLQVLPQALPLLQLILQLLVALQAPAPFSLHSEQVSFHRAGGTFPTPSMGSMNTVSKKPTSGTHRAQATWPQRLSTVLLRAPPLLGQKRHWAGPAEPLALRDVGDTVALLVHADVTRVTEEDDVAVSAVSIHADAADGILVHRGAPLTQGLLLQAVHEELEEVGGDLADTLAPPPVVEELQPGIVLLVQVVLHLLVQLLLRRLRIAVEGSGPSGNQRQVVLHRAEPRLREAAALWPRPPGPLGKAAALWPRPPGPLGEAAALWPRPPGPLRARPALLLLTVLQAGRANQDLREFLTVLLVAVTLHNLLCRGRVVAHHLQFVVDAEAVEAAISLQLNDALSLGVLDLKYNQILGIQCGPHQILGIQSGPQWAPDQGSKSSSGPGCGHKSLQERVKNDPPSPAHNTKATSPRSQGGGASYFAEEDSQLGVEQGIPEL